MALRFEVFGDKLDLADELQDEFHGEAKAAMADAAEMLLDEIRRLLSLRHGPPAAPEGEPPAMQTGDLAAAFKTVRPKVRGRVAESGIQARGEAAEGANRLEHGFTDRRGIRTLPHPFIRVAIANMEDPIGRLLEERLS